MARIGLAMAGLGALAALTACGGRDFADRSADEILKAATADMRDLRTAEVSGRLTWRGQETSLDLRSSSDGDCTGSIGMGHGSAELLGVGGSLWLRPDESFWRSFGGDNAEEMQAVVGDRWVAVPDEEESLHGFCDLDDLLDQLLEDDGSTRSKDGTDTLDGDDVVRIDDEGPDDATSTGYVLVDDPHYVVRVERTDARGTGSVTFSGFDEPFEVSEPAGDDVFDPDELAG